MATLALSNRPLVTLVTPARDAAETLPRMFDSVARQTVADWEHLVVVRPEDSATAAVVRDRASRDPRVSLLLKETSTAGGARNAALPSISGAYLLFLDADDTIGSRHLEHLLKDASHTGADAVYGGYRRLSPAGRAITIRRASDELDELLGSGPLTALHAMLFRSDLIHRINGFDPGLKTNEDWDLCLRAREVGAAFRPSKATSAHYWTGHASLSSDGAAMVESRRTVAARAAAGAGFQDPAAAGLDALNSVLWNGAVALARGACPDGLSAWLAPCGPAQADAAAAAETLLDGLMVGFACRPEQVEKRLAGHWPQLERFLQTVSGRCDDEGFADATMRKLEWHLARLGGGWRSWRIGGSEVVPLLNPFRAIDGTRADQVIIRLPLLRPRALATQAFAPQVANGRRAIALLAQRAFDRLLELPGADHRLALPRDKALRKATVALRLLRKAFGKQAPPPSQAVDPQGLSGDDRWEAIFASEDPWNYHCPYEQLKYERTLSLLPEAPVGRALELACAEGLFSVQLAPRVERLTAADISVQALDRAARRARDHGLENVTFEQLDFFSSDIGTSWDLIVCSEVLYYMASPQVVADFARRVAEGLAPGGLFLHAHAYEVTDTPQRTGFDWGDALAAGTISRCFQAEPGLTFVRAIETELYRVELYQKAGGKQVVPEVENASARPGLHAELAADVVWNGAIMTRIQAEAERCYRLPVLMYHSVSTNGPEALATWRLDPAEFERQLVFLRRRGYRSIDLEEWDYARRQNGAVGGRPILLTFDDGFVDFAETAWPILQRNGFGAHVFLVSGRVGTRADWDAFYGDPPPLMDWDTIRKLAQAGVTFGSHLHSHRPLDRLGFAEAEREMRRSREVIEQELGYAPATLATPYGNGSIAFAELARKAGFHRLFGIDGGPAPVVGSPLQTPRIEIGGNMTLQDFAAAVGVTEMPDDQDTVPA